MQRHLRQLCTLAVLSTLTIAIVPIKADDVSREDQRTVVVYPVADLPVYLAPRGVEAQFQPALLVSLLKAELGPDHWQSERDSIAPHERTSALVIRTTRANHKRLSAIIESLRRELRPADAPEEEAAELGLDDDLGPLKRQEQQKTSATDVYDRLRTSVLNTIFRAECQRTKSAKEAAALIDAEIQKVGSAGLSDREKAPLVSSLTRIRVKILTGEYPCSDSKEQSSSYEPLTQKDLEALRGVACSHAAGG